MLEPLQHPYTRVRVKKAACSQRYKLFSNLFDVYIDLLKLFSGKIPTFSYLIA